MHFAGQRQRRSWRTPILIFPHLSQLERPLVQIDVRQFADTTVAAPGERIDHRSAPALEAALLPLVDQAIAAKGALVLDFSAVAYISSVGLRVLMIASKQARSAGVSLAIAAMQPIVAEIFQISRFDTLIACHTTVEQALAERPGQAAPALRRPARP